MSKQAQKANKRRLARQSNGILGTRANPQSPPAPKLNAPHGLLEYVEHPVILAGLLIIGGIAGLIFFTPILLLCEACLLLALHGSKVLQGRGKLYQGTAYSILFLLTAPSILAFGVYARNPVRDYFRQMVSPSSSVTKVPKLNVPGPAVSNPIPPPGGIFNPPNFNETAASETRNDSPSQVPNNQYPPNSPYATMMRQMRERLTRDAGNPQKISDDVQWMREQFELGWTTEPPELAKKHREETEQTARLILAAASNRNAVLNLLPHITIDK